MTSDRPDFEEFFARHRDEVVRGLTLALGDRPAAEDATQEAFATAYRRWRRVRSMDRPVAWVYVVALNRARRIRRRELAAPRPDPLGPVPDLAGVLADRATVRVALAALAPRQRLAVVLRFVGDLTVAEVAEAMGCSVGTAKATLHQALARMRVTLADPEGPSDTDLDRMPRSAPIAGATAAAPGSAAPGSDRYPIVFPASPPTGGSS